MSRFKRFTHSFLSGCVVLGATGLFKLASLPLANAYLNDKEFGLWVIALVIGGYISLIDFGMSGSISRILIDYKDRRATGEFGGIVKTAALVGVMQGLIIFVIGAALAFFIGGLLNVSKGVADYQEAKTLERDFVLLMVGQCALLCVTFSTRIFSHLLTAHQRFDITNYAQTVLFAGQFVVMWFCFKRGFGVFSLLIAQAAGTALLILINLGGCLWLKLFPKRGEWGRATWRQFKELFAFSKDIFLYSLGAQLIGTSQSLLLIPVFGVEIAGIWNICTQAYQYLIQLVCRVFDFSTTSLAEMIVHKEKELLQKRFREIVIVTASLAVAGGAVFTICNTPFVHVWFRGKDILQEIKTNWSPLNDLLLAVWLLVSTSGRTHIGLVGQTKEFRFLRYIYFIEGLVFVGLTTVLKGHGGISLMIVVSILCSLSFSLPYGLWRSRGYFKLSRHEFSGWYRAPLALASWVAPVAVLVWWFTKDFTPFKQLAFNLAIVGSWSGWMFLRHGLGKPLQLEIIRRAPNWAKPLLERIALPKTTS